MLHAAHREGERRLGRYRIQEGGSRLVRVFTGGTVVFVVGLLLDFSLPVVGALSNILVSGEQLRCNIGRF